MRLRNRTLTIANGATTSDTLPFDYYLRFAKSLQISGPATLPETVTVQVSIDGGTTWSVLQSGGADVTVTAGDATVISPITFKQLRLVAGSAVAAERSFQVGGDSD